VNRVWSDVCNGSKPEELELSKCLPLFTQLRTFGGATLPTANLAASRIFFKQLANRRDAHAEKIISFFQNYECCIII
jgi:hypothetical protein